MLESLKKSALESCKFRGHSMGEWVSARNGGAMATCIMCLEVAAVNPNPAPNEIDIGGQAVAVDCEG